MTLTLRGAVAVDPASRDAGVAWHYGDPLREQRALAEGRGFVDLSHRPVVRVAGPDRLGWLHSLTSQHLEHLEPDLWTQALLLSPNGHVEHHLDLVDADVDGTGRAVWAHVEPGTAEPLVAFLDSMRFWSRVEVADVSAAWAVLWRPAAGFVLVPRDGLAGYVDGLVAAGEPPAGLWAYEALRVAAGRPRLGAETDHRTIPHEVGWVGPAVHLDKGCYRGQETVARVQNLGRPPRRLVLLHLDGSVDELPPHGAAVSYDGRPVGFVGTAAYHYELGPIALAVVKRAVPVEAALDVDLAAPPEGPRSEVHRVRASQQPVVAP